MCNLLSCLCHTHDVYVCVYAACCALCLQSQLDLLVAAVCGLRDHLQADGNRLHVDLLLQGPGGTVHLSPEQDETLRVVWGARDLVGRQDAI